MERIARIRAGLAVALLLCAQSMCARAQGFVAGADVTPAQ